MPRAQAGSSSRSSGNTRDNSRLFAEDADAAPENDIGPAILAPKSDAGDSLGPDGIHKTGMMGVDEE